MNNLKIFGQADPGALSQIENCLQKGGEKAVLCADNHKGYAMPIGGVVAYKDKISVSGVGFDIACGNMAIRTDAWLPDVEKNMDIFLDKIVEDISFGVGKTNKLPQDHDLFHNHWGWDVDWIAPLKSLARQQLGTVGSGNHYVDIFYDENGAIWVGVHFGSRGLGHKIASKTLELAGAKDGMDVDPCVLDVDSTLGKEYLVGMALGGAYAYAGREWVARHVVQNILGANILEEVHNHHNYAWEEEHYGEKLWVVRKGATPAEPGQKGFVGGSMGDQSVILEGVDSPEAKNALYSTVHGAGRVMSRTAAKGKFIRTPEGKKIRGEGLVRHDEMVKWLHDKKVNLRGGDLDEAPQAYRRLPEVLAAHDGTIKILHWLTPLGVVMAGRDCVDPYKD